MKKLLLLILLPIIFYSNGCFTYYNVSERPDSLNLNDGRYYRIQKLFYIKGFYENVEDTDIDYYEKFGNAKRVLVYTKYDSTRDRNNPGEFKISKSKKIIPLDSLNALIIERKKNDLKSSLITGLIIVTSVVVLYMISFSIALHSGKFHI
ncbi:MAG: hypothetical protein HY959_13515 [Ignavibacteriae bacterium]|nr:hypothetical protein [Ignavibacteriota bacterium]